MQQATGAVKPLLATGRPIHTDGMGAKEEEEEERPIQNRSKISSTTPWQCGGEAT